MPQQQQISPAQINAMARAAIRAQSVRMTQQVTSQTGLQTQTQFTVKFQNVGLVLGFWVKVVHTVSNGSAVQLNLTDLGPANAASNITFQDFMNVTRINTPGWHVHLVNTAKMRRPFGTALVRGTGFDSPVGYGANGAGQISAPATIAPAGTGTVTMWYYVPCAYSNDDLRGCIYANVTNATAQLQLSFPGTNGVTVARDNGVDSTLAMYVGNVAGSTALATITNTTVVVYQTYYDQLPKANGGLLLPITDLATAYELKQTVLTGFAAGQDNPYQYGNYRDFLSTFAVYVNAAAGTRQFGQDINTWALLAANLTPIWKLEPALVFLQNRNVMQTDFPAGVYYFDTRERPISTTQYGNMQLVNNPITAAAGNYQLVATEDFALLSTLSTAGSLAAN